MGQGASIEEKRRIAEKIKEQIDFDWQLARNVKRRHPDQYRDVSEDSLKDHIKKNVNKRFIDSLIRDG